MSRVERARARAGLTALPFVARASDRRAARVPALNATLEGETHTVHDGVHLGIAVSLGEDGPDRAGHPATRRTSASRASPSASRTLARAARAQPAAPRTTSAAARSRSPTRAATARSSPRPVINQPQVAILDLEAVVKRPVVVTDEDGNDSIAIRPMTYLCMSWDHRALDGALAAQFLSSLRKKLETWPI